MVFPVNTAMVLEMIGPVLNTSAMKNRLRELREAQRPTMSQARLAEMVNTSQAQIDRLEKGDRKLTVEWAELLAPCLGCSPIELLFSEGEIVKAASGQTANDNSAYVEVNRFALRAAAGAGIDAGATPKIAGQLVFRRDWIKRVTDAPLEDIAVFTVSGDSMKPTLADGDVVLIDTTRKTPSEDFEIFVILRDGALQVKRIAVDPGGQIHLTTDNPKAPSPEPYEEGPDHIVGKVIWLGRQVI